jgi:hypothetical protein
MLSLHGQPSSIIYVLSEKGPLCLVLHGVPYYICLREGNFSRRGLEKQTPAAAAEKNIAEAEKEAEELYTPRRNEFAFSNLCPIGTPCYNAPSIRTNRTNSIYSL